MVKIGLVLIVLALVASPRVAEAQDACSVNICYPDSYYGGTTSDPYWESTMELMVAALLGVFLVWTVVTEFGWTIIWYW